MFCYCFSLLLLIFFTNDVHLFCIHDAYNTKQWDHCLQLFSAVHVVYGILVYIYRSIYPSLIYMDRAC